MNRIGRLAILGIVLVIPGSGAAWEDAKKKEDIPKLRKWKVRFLEWKLTDQKKIELWRKRRDESIPNDAKEIASVSVFRRDNEKSAVIVTFGEGICGARFIPRKLGADSFTSIDYFYLTRAEAKGVTVHPGGTYTQEEKELMTGKPIMLSRISHGVGNPKGGYKSLTIQVTTVTVKEIDQKSIDTVMDSFTKDPKLP